MIVVTAVRTGGKGAVGMSVLIIERGPGLKTRILPTQAGSSSGQAYVTVCKISIHHLHSLDGIKSCFHANSLKTSKSQLKTFWELKTKVSKCSCSISTRSVSLSVWVSHDLPECRYHLIRPRHMRCHKRLPLV